MNEWMNEWRKEGRKEGRKEWMNEGMNEWMNEWRNEWMNEWIIYSEFIGASSDRLPSVGWLMSSFQHSCTASTFAIELNRIPIPPSELVNPGALHSQASDLRLLASNSQRHNKVWRSQSLPPAQCWAFPLPCAKHCRGCCAGTLATRNGWESVIRVVGLIRFACASMTRDEIEKMHDSILSASQKAWLPVLLADSASTLPSRVPSLILVHRLPQFHPADHLAMHHYFLASRKEILN